MKTDYMRTGGGQSVCTAPDNNLMMRALARPTVHTSTQIMHAWKLYYKVFLRNIGGFMNQGQAKPLTGSRALVNHSCEENSTRAAKRAAKGDIATF